MTDTPAPLSDAEQAELIQRLSKPTLLEWLRERLDNCQRLASLKTDKAVRDGWMEDARYFSDAISALAAATKPPKWLPMQTAKRDGNEIIYLHKDGYVSSCSWCEADEGKPGDFWWDEACTQEVEPLGWLPKPKERP